MAANRKYRTPVGQGISGMLDNAFQIWREEFVPVSLLSLLGYLPFALLFLMYVHALVGAAQSTATQHNFYFRYAFLITCALYWKGLFRGALAHYVGTQIEAGGGGVRASVWAALRHSLALGACTGLGLLGVVFGSILVLPLVLSFVASVAVSAVVLKDRNFLQALSEFFVGIVQNKKKYYLFQIVLGSACLFIFLNMLIGLWLTVSLSKSFFNMDPTVLNTELSLLNPFFVAVAFVIGQFFFETLWSLSCQFFYYDCTSRKSGADLAAELSAMQYELQPAGREAKRA